MPQSSNGDPRPRRRRPLIVIPPLDSRLFAAGITLIWAAFLTYLARQPDIPYAPLVPLRAVSPMAHFGTFFVLSSLIYLVAGSGRRSWSGAAGVLAISIALSVGLALSLELMQDFLPSRVPQTKDIVYDAAGAIAGATTILLLTLMRVERRALSLAGALVVLALMSLTTASIVKWDPSHPRVGDHWHARYRIVVCGVTQPPLPGTHGGVHTHGGGGIHIHPRTKDEAFSNASLALFFSTSGGALTDQSLTLPSGLTFANGDRCPDGRGGQLSVTVNGDPIGNPSSYVFRNQKAIVISFD